MNAAELKHVDLQARVQAVHVDLRRKYRESGNSSTSCVKSPGSNWGILWKDHTGNMEVLKVYSEAMHDLATRIWDPRNTKESNQNKQQEEGVKGKVKCRIEWVVSQCEAYFREQIDTGDRLRLLDVGSCYNPFSKHMTLFDITAIDLCPARGYEESVFQADFLEVEIRGQGQEQEGEKDFVLEVEPNGWRRLRNLTRNDFDLAVFSFFLEYLPDPRQRLQSCLRAYDLIRPSGLLFILRPDSNSVTASTMKLITEMKVGLGLVGFRRLACEKLQHLWCTSFIKLSEGEKGHYLESPRFKKDLAKVRFTDLYQLFAIPQDFSEFADDNEVVELEKVDVDPALFDELPGF